MSRDSATRTARSARDGGKMWTEEDTVRFLEEWHRLNLAHPKSSRTEKTAHIRPLFMNRSDRSVTSKIDLELKRLRGEQSDPYPHLNALRERVYGVKAVANDGSLGEEDDDDDDGEEDDRDDDEEGSGHSYCAEGSSHTNELVDDAEMADEVEAPSVPDTKTKENQNENIQRIKGLINGDSAREEPPLNAPELVRRRRKKKRLNKRRRQLREKAAATGDKQTRSRISRLIRIGSELGTQPSAAWLGEGVYAEYCKAMTLYAQLRTEKDVLKDYMEVVEGELRILRGLLDDAG